jgi:hypothetical protein
MARRRAKLSQGAARVEGERSEPKVPDPREALLCYVDVNNDYGLAVVNTVFD